jgi:hypothetical protein
MHIESYQAELCFTPVILKFGLIFFFSWIAGGDDGGKEDPSSSVSGALCLL